MHCNRCGDTMMPSAMRCHTCQHLNDEQLQRLLEHVEPARANHRRRRSLGAVGVVGSTLVAGVAARLTWEVVDSEVALNVAWLALIVVWFLALARSLHMVWVHHEQGSLRHQIRRLLPTTTITEGDPVYSFTAFVEENANTKH